MLGITRERVRQLETRALRELRDVAPSLELYLQYLSSPAGSAERDGFHLVQRREAPQRLDLDLPHALAREPEPAADLLERLRLGVAPSP